MFKADHILRQLLAVSEKYPDCALDVTGGSDAALFAAGMFTAQTGVPAFTYSRKKNCFYDICGAAFAEDLPSASLLFCGGVLPDGGRHAAPRTGGQRHSGEISRRLEPFFSCFLRFRYEWTSLITYIQRVSPSEYGQTPPFCNFTAATR